ncbi:MAG: glycosyltransferase family 2 protein [Blastocatellales bacterium]
MAEHQLSISIITVSYNQAQYIEETIRSVLCQNYPNLQYVVIDGASTDRSLDVIGKYRHGINYLISEPDDGQVPALNKGLAKCTGEIVAFINSDDLYLPGAFNAVADYFQKNPDCSWLCGDVILFGDYHRTEIINSIVPVSPVQALTWKSQSPQPGMFWRRELLTDCFDESLNYCFDHELYVRLLLAGKKCHHLKMPIAAYRLHPSSKTISEQHKFEVEFDQIAERYEPMLNFRGRSLSKAIRYVRKSYKMAATGEQRMAIQWLAKSLVASPEITLQRPFWGSLKKIIYK